MPVFMQASAFCIFLRKYFVVRVDYGLLPKKSAVRTNAGVIVLRKNGVKEEKPPRDPVSERFHGLAAIW